MNTQVTKIELIEMLLKENNQSSLLAIKKILQSSSESETDVIEIKKQLEKSEKQYQNGEGIDYESILNESEMKYFSK
ncbi:hypothetical protein H4V97_002476 [Flavobacterium sp. CG_23.5]|uniref:hypothetical protein n=1 Tax=unclassified Flavobacterium TaxID=196869 RepID=UPI0018CBEFBF|nr:MULTISPECIES: hypothetical protein [unclassified Flavobacterium]MBG6110246.1 hypothetical protein [Flavobacterium sp. CG_9.10]MBP2284158.1 hypothetical protein [Flavobacterium sp. CG_23.5]